MLRGPLPKLIDPVALARAGTRVVGDLPLADLTRLCGCLTDDAGVVDVALEFGTGEGRLRYVRGRLRVRVSLICQRCLQPMELELEQPVELEIVPSDEAARSLHGDRDPLVATGESLDLATLVEDELLLALPFAPMHELDACPAAGEPHETEEEVEPSAARERGNPFSVLAALKKDRD